ncbi:hypothetical protein [Streptomyces sp. NPDC097610]|uniref:hypothetical protein n=1 Tax=Streptomyces sp. NPDC097610 TaxID=3157227 RepID=UPI00332D9420
MGEYLPDNRDIEVKIGDQMFTPLGILVNDLLEKEDGVSSALMTRALRDTFDYHGMHISELEGEPGRFSMEGNSRPRPTGWEDSLIQELDARFSVNPALKFGSEVFSSGNRPDLPFEFRMTELTGMGLTVRNWQSLPHLIAAFERHQIPVKISNEVESYVRIDREAYEAGLRERDIATRARISSIQPTGESSNIIPDVRGERRHREYGSSSPTGSPPPQRRRR